MLRLQLRSLRVPSPPASGRWCSSVIPCRQPRSAPFNFQWTRRNRAVLTSCPIASSSEASVSATQPPLSEFELPEEKFQRPLSMKEILDWRTHSNTLARNGKIQRISVGQNGVTQNFLAACMDVLSHHEILRVKLGEGSGLDREESATLLASYLDCAVVHKVGYTITLYREAGLPRPSNLPDVLREQHLLLKKQKEAVRVIQSEEEIAASKKARAAAKAKGRTSTASLARVQAARLQAKKEPKGPPAFEVL